MAVVTVVPLHSMIREALKNLRDARSDGDPGHDPLRCAGACLICSNERALNRLLDRLQRRQENHV